MKQKPWTSRHRTRPGRFGLHLRTRAGPSGRSASAQSYNGKALSKLRKKYVFGDFSLLFKFPSGPHDYGRLFVTNSGSHGLNEISQLHVLPGGALSLALLGWGQDASGEIYALGNISGVPFPDPVLGPTGRVLKLVPAPETND